MVQNKGLIFKEIPGGTPVVGKHIAVGTRDFDLDQAPPPNGCTAKVHYVSFDPYQRPRMRRPEIKSYTPAYVIGKPITNNAVVTVIKSDNPAFKPGDLVYAPGSYTEEYTTVVMDQDKVGDVPSVIHNPYNLDPKIFVGALGMSGLTAYSSLYEIGAPKKGETLLVSAASGAVGQVVGQLAKHEGLRVIGSVGSEEKLNFCIKELGFDGGFNYKKEKPLEAMRRLAPEGIDIYYDNVGGEQLEAALTCLNDFGRIVACGMVPQYNKAPEDRYGIKNLLEVVFKRIKIQGFIVRELRAKYTEAHQKDLQKWIHDGTFKVEMSVTQGIDHAGEGFVEMLMGKNFGKALLEVSPLQN